jgi:hypothetical protein
MLQPASRKDTFTRDALSGGSGHKVNKTYFAGVSDPVLITFLRAEPHDTKWSWAWNMKEVVTDPAIKQTIAGGNQTGGRTNLEQMDDWKILSPNGELKLGASNRDQGSQGTATFIIIAHRLML